MYCEISDFAFQNFTIMLYELIFLYTVPFRF